MEEKQLIKEKTIDDLKNEKMKNKQEFINEAEKIKLQNKESIHQLKIVVKEKNMLKMKTCKEDEWISKDNHTMTKSND